MVTQKLSLKYEDSLAVRTMFAMLQQKGLLEDSTAIAGAVYKGIGLTATERELTAELSSLQKELIIWSLLK